MRLDPPHEKGCVDEQKCADRKRYSNGQEFHRAISRLAILNQGEQACSHAEYDQQQQDSNDDFYHGTTRVRLVQTPMLTEQGCKLP